MRSLIYVSRRNRPTDGRDDVQDIVTVARSRNRELAVTGALIVTPTHFAQLLEGARAPLAELMSSIERDRRHRIMHLVDLDSQPQRAFAGWSLAYHGESSYVSKMLSDAVAASNFELGAHVENIRALMQMFA